MNDNNKLEELSFLLPIVGTLLFTPVFLSVFNHNLTVFGIPALHIYIFTCWIILIFASFILTRKLRDTTSSASASRESSEVDYQNIEIDD